MQLVEGKKFGDNRFEIIGTLTDKELEEKFTANQKLYLDGFIEVTSKKDDKENIFKINVKIYELDYKGDLNDKYEKQGLKLKNEYNIGDKIKVIGTVSMAEYYNDDLELISFQQLKGNQFYHVDKEEKDQAFATIDTFIQGTNVKEDGSMDVKGFSIGWGENLVDLKNLYVPKELAPGFSSMYFTNTTGKLSIELEDYLEQQEKQVQETGGFGEIIDLTVQVFDKKIRGLRVVGGQQPYTPAQAWNEDDVKRAKQKREQKLEENKQWKIQNGNSNGFTTGFTPSEEKEIAAVESAFDENPFA